VFGRLFRPLGNKGVAALTGKEPHMNREERQRLIERYAQGPAEVRRSLEGFPKDQLVAKPFPGKWSAAEIVHHLSDSETISGIRLRRLLAENLPVIHGYDQEEYARRLKYNERDIAPSLANFEAVRVATTQVLKLMGDDDWKRPGWHTEGGAYDAERWLEIYAAHAHDHAAQITRLREALTAHAR